mgnify:CR=1 FL=1
MARKLRDAAGRQSCVAVPMERFEDRLQEAALALVEGAAELLVEGLPHNAHRQVIHLRAPELGRLRAVGALEEEMLVQP